MKIYITGNNYIKLTSSDIDNIEKKYKIVTNIQEADLIISNHDIDVNKTTITLEDFFEKYLHKLYIPIDCSFCEHLKYIKPYTKIQYIIKRGIDYFVSIPLMFISSFIMIYAAYKIKKESPDGPIIFKQTRIGKNGKPFTCYKFRSMRTDVEFFNHYTQENDPRIFRWGEIMRKTRIDELPQLWNVLKGDLHLIGPRAEWDELVKQYEKKWKYYHLRHINAPGITGWAQVNYPYGKDLEDTRQKLMYDLYYFKNWSLGLEIKTIFKTAMVMIGKKGL